jgi:hypothetical protein
VAWLPDTEMADIHIIRQDYAIARNTHEADPTPATLAALQEQEERRARAIRSLHRDDGENVKHLAGMFRCSKKIIRAALEEETE